jgi:hypothetical protein
VSEQVATQLSAAAALGDERTPAIAGALAAAAAPAVRLAVLEASSQVADEVTAALLDVPGGPVVSVRLDSSNGGEDEVVVDVRLTDAAAASSAPPRDDGDPSARISLRLSETLKADVEAAAARDGVSVNTWLVRAAGAALGPGPFPGFGRPFGGAMPAGGDRPRHPRANNQHVTGWVNG